MNAIMLISKPIHMQNHEGDLTTIRVLMISIIINKMLLDNRIRKEKTLYPGYEPDSLLFSLPYFIVYGHIRF